MLPSLPHNVMLYDRYLKNVLMNILHKFSHHNLGIIAKHLVNHAMNLLTKRHDVLKNISRIKLALLTDTCSPSSTSKCMIKSHTKIALVFLLRLGDQLQSCVTFSASQRRKQNQKSLASQCLRQPRSQGSLLLFPWRKSRREPWERGCVCDGSCFCSWLTN